MEWTPAIAPAAAAFYTGGYPAWRDNLLVAALRGEALLRIVVERSPGTRTGWRAVAAEPLVSGALGRLRAVVMAPDGSVYLTTSNHDGRGEARPGDDYLFRLVPGGGRSATPARFPR